MMYSVKSAEKFSKSCLHGFEVLSRLPIEVEKLQFKIRASVPFVEGESTFCEPKK